VVIKRLFYVFAILLLAGSLPATAQEAGSVGTELDDTAELWFVELSSSPTADGGRLRDTERDKAGFLKAAGKAGLRFSERFAFDTLWNGLSIRVDKADVAKLARIPGVAALYPVDELQLDPQPVDGIDLFSALAMTGADIAQKTRGYS